MTFNFECEASVQRFQRVESIGSPERADGSDYPNFRAAWSRKGGETPRRCRGQRGVSPGGNGQRLTDFLGVNPVSTRGVKFLAGRCISLIVGAMAGGMPYGLASMLKEGHKHLEEPVFKNIDACKQLAMLTRTSMGPQGKICHDLPPSYDLKAKGCLRLQLILLS